MRKSNLVLIIIAGLVVVLGLGFIGSSNSLNQSQQNFQAKQGDLQAALQRRNDLIPNLVSSVKGSMNNEQSALQKITDARKVLNNNASTTAQKAEASQTMTTQGGIVINAIRENYPTLASNDNVKTLMTQLEGSENRIKYARTEYNKAVQTYNNKVVSFPSSFVAQMSGKQTVSYFQADTSAQNAPSVTFDNK